MSLSFLHNTAEGVESLHAEIYDNVAIPWPARYYYLHSNYAFVAKVMWEARDLSFDYPAPLQTFINSPNV